ncbi:hypothetical protein AB1Y20_000080 [Prymnesium parvum]|uniref:Small ribosomal subunit protein mS41 SAM domain-containing protein n=1 Tax=Prymnesium parvum TaxID=97485 RepID=A0AB34K8X9_PRYPA
MLLFRRLLPLAPARWLCAASEAQAAELSSFLRNASRPKMGKAKAKQSAGQRALDLLKHLPRLEGTSLPQLLRMKSKQLAKLGMPCQERKRLLKFTHKVKCGWTYEGKKEGNWRAWRDPGFSQQAWVKAKSEPTP